MLKECLICKKEFITYPSLIKKGEGKFPCEHIHEYLKVKGRK